MSEPPRCVPSVTVVVPSSSHQLLERDTGVKLSLSPGRALLLGGLWAACLRHGHALCPTLLLCVGKGAGTGEGK